MGIGDWGLGIGDWGSEPKLAIDLQNLDDHVTNFKLLMNSLQKLIKENGENQKIIDNFNNFFDVKKIIEKDENTLLNLAKLLLFTTSLSSEKENHMSILSSIDNNFQNEFIFSCQFIQLKGISDITTINLNKNNNSDKNILINEISFFLSGGDFLHKKIDILDETIIKNSEMYNSILDKTEKQMKELKQSKIDLETFNDQKTSEIEELKQKIEELINQLNNKNEENIQLKKALDEFKLKKENELSEYQKQIKDITDLKNQEIEMLNNKIQEIQNNQNEKASTLKQDFEKYKITSIQMNRELVERNDELKKQVENIPLLQEEIDKLKNYFENSETEKLKMQNEIFNYQEKYKEGEKIKSQLAEKITILEQKLNSEPYYAREILSKTLYDFSLKMMSENN